MPKGNIPTIIYKNAIPATFVQRLNRFTAEALINGQPEFGQAMRAAAKAGV